MFSTEEKKSRIIEAAAKVFARKGYAATRIAEVAVEAGIGKGTVYEYFKSKEALFFDVFQWLFAGRAVVSRFSVDIETLGGTAAERLMALNDAIITAWMKEMDSFVLIMEFWSASASSAIRDQFKTAFKAAYENFGSLVSKLLHAGIATGEFRPDTDVEAVAAALVGTWDALLLQKWFESVENPLAYSQEFLKIVLRGLSTE